MAYSEDTGLRLLDVPPGPSASAGLQVGDRIVEVDGQPVRNLSYSEIVERLRGRAGTEVELGVARDSELIHLTLTRTRYESP